MICCEYDLYLLETECILQCISWEPNSFTPSKPATFVQRLPNVFQTSMAFETRWVAVVQMSLVHWASSYVPTGLRTVN